MPPRIHDSATVDDLLSIEAQPEQRAFVAALTPDVAAVLLDAGPSRSITDDAGNVLLCCGVIPFHQNRVHAWTLLSHRASRHMPFLVRSVLKFLESLPCRRVEMTIREGFSAGVKWARILGFTPEGVMRAYAENGDNCILYARIQQ